MVWTVRSAVTAILATTIIGASLGTISLPARAEPVIDITKGVVEPMPIAVPVFGGANPADNQLGAEIARVVAADLERSGLFKPIDDRAFIQQGLTADALPRFQDWRLINAQALVAGSVKPGAGGKYSVEYRLWDVFGGTEMFAQSYNITPGHLAARRPTSSPTTSTSASPARRAISTPASSTSRSPDRRTTARSASPSWTRMARTISS